MLEFNKNTIYHTDMAAAYQSQWEKEKYAIVCLEGVNPYDCMLNNSKFDSREWGSVIEKKPFKAPSKSFEK